MKSPHLRCIPRSRPPLNQVSKSSFSVPVSPRTTASPIKVIKQPSKTISIPPQGPWAVSATYVPFVPNNSDTLGDPTDHNSEIGRYSLSRDKALNSRDQLFMELLCWNDTSFYSFSGIVGLLPPPKRSRNSSKVASLQSYSYPIAIESSFRILGKGPITRQGTTGEVMEGRFDIAGLSGFGEFAGIEGSGIMKFELNKVVENDSSLQRFKDGTCTFERVNSVGERLL
ncbi:MAG: hypothetical protein Q9186_002868 [Xanthomendoza sp. 1 TL-2023]